MSPVTAKIDDESTKAVANAVVRLVAPGPTDVLTIAGTFLFARK
jgi:hypothetical protein